MNVALQLFSNKGFNATSIKEIADTSGIGKGSVYNYFESKDELFISIFEKTYDDMFIQGNKILNELKISNEEKILRIIEFQIIYFMNNKFIMLDTNYNEIPIEKTDRFASIKRVYIEKKTNWQKEILHNHYGREIEEYLNDLLVIFRGILSQCLNLIVYESIPIKSSKLAEFIVLKMNIIVKDFISNNPEPLLHNKISWNNTHFENEKKINEIFNLLRDSIALTNLDNLKKEELKDIADMLQSELQSTNPRRFLIKSLTSTLEIELDNSFYINKLKLLYNM